MKIDSNKQHGQLVWAKMSKTSKPWAGMIICQEKLDLVCFKEIKGKTIVWWFCHNTFSQVKNELIYEFSLEIKSYLNNLSGQRKQGIMLAIKVLCFQKEFKLPAHFSKENNIVTWASKTLPIIMKKGNRKLTSKQKSFYDEQKLNEQYKIPYYILDDLKMTNNTIRHLKEKAEQEQKLQKKNTSQTPIKNGSKCMACKLIVDEPYINNHPLFNGFLCKNCFIKGKDIILSISGDKSNDGCCICFKLAVNLVLCSFCIRVYCEKCLDFYCGKTGLTKILEEKTWQCLACSTTPKSTSGRLISKSLNQQLENIYSLYSTTDSMKNCTQPKKIDELYVMNLKDIQAIVPHILETFKCPYKLIEKKKLNETVKINTRNTVKLILQSYASDKGYNKDDNFDASNCLKKFFSFIRMRKDFKALQTKDIPLFWAFETNASINFEAKKIISRFCKHEPILIGNNALDVLEYGRFIWTNITILKKNLKPYNKQNIFLYPIATEVGKSNHYDKDTPGCYGSIELILSSFIHNDIIFFK